MNFIKKFYEAAISEGAGGAVEAVKEAPQYTSMAEAMAKAGTKSDENSPVKTPIDKVVKVEETKDEIPAVAKTEEIEKPKVEVPETQEKPNVEEAKAETPKPAEQPKPQLTLDEVLKNEQPSTIFKKLGFSDQTATFLNELKDADPKILGIVQAWKEGKLGDYVKELSTDYQKMSAEEVMRHQLRQEYPKATDKQFKALYDSEIVERYKLDSDIYSETEVENGIALLEAKADKYRDTLSENQQKYLLPEKPTPIVDNSPKPEELQRQQIEAYRKELSENPYTKDIIANKKITIGEGDEKFSYPVEASELLDVLTDPAKWVETMYDKDGEHFVPKVEHQLMVAAFSQDSKKFLSEYAKHLKSLGGKQVADKIDNASAPDKSTSAKSDQLPTSAASAMAKSGVRRD